MTAPTSRYPATAPLSSAMRTFLASEAAGGAALVVAAALAMMLANSALAGLYDAFLSLRGTVRIGEFAIDKPLLLWINDGLMAIFFMLVGLELKREFLEGELSSRERAMLPAICALGGMAVPALIYVTINFAHPENQAGWAIPAATDIAFALGVLALLGKRVPASVKVLLLAIAALDDFAAIIVIALFYTESLSVTSLSLASIAVAGLVALNLTGVRRVAPYMIVGAVLWVCVLKSGVHATLAGVIVAFAIPNRSASGEPTTILRSLEHGLHPWVAFGVLPLFAFANAGVSLKDVGLYNFADPVQLGIFFGLFIGKPVGIFGVMKLMIGRGIVPMPEGANWMMLFGLACLCGIGFTMSLFIGGLAWEHANLAAQIRLGVITGSIVSATAGLMLLLRATADAGRSP